MILSDSETFRALTIAMSSIETQAVVTRQGCDAPHTGSKTFRTIAGRVVSNGCPELKKARYGWQVKNSWAAVDSGRHDHLNARSSSPEPTVTCSTVENVDNQCKASACFDQECNSSNSNVIVDCDSSENRPLSDNPLTLRGSFHQDLQNNEATNTCQEMTFSQALSSSCNEQQWELCSATLAQNETMQSTVSSDVPEDPHTSTYPLGNWMLEYSLMRAKLDNDINQALEDVRRFADRETKQTQQAYVMDRISLETAGIIQVIEQKGLRTCSRLFHVDSPSDFQRIGPYASSNPHCNSDMVILANTGSGEINQSASAAYSHQQQCSLELRCCNLNSSGALLSPPPGSNFIIDRAVSSAIFECGIHL